MKKTPKSRKKTVKVAPKRRPAAPRAKTQTPSRTRKPGPAPRSRTPAVVEASVEPALPLPVEREPELAVVLATPEPAFASRVEDPEPDRPLPAARRAIFYDVENASRPEHISRVIDHLAVDRMGRRTDFVAVGNWRVIGHDTARLLARHGANLVHSAPSTGVRDWSDLRIAVAAGVWLATARPGDVLEIVTNDRAFDAVGDVASSLGIAFRRLSHQGLGGVAPEPAPPAREAADPRRSRRSRGRHRASWRDRPSGSTSTAPSRTPMARPPERVDVGPSADASPLEPEVSAPAPPVAEPVPDLELAAASSGAGADAASSGVQPHTAPHDEIIAIVRDLMQRSGSRPVTLDSLANALKARGFSRPPGSPRLITRIRRIKEITLSRTGVITLVPAAAEPRAHAEEEPSPPEPVAEHVEPEAAAPEVEVADAAEVADDEGPQPGNEALPSTQPVDAAARRRWPRRSGRGRYRRPAAAPAV